MAVAEAPSASLKGRSANSMNEIKQELAKQPKIKVMVPRPPHVKKGLHFRIPVSINGYTVQVPTGCFSEMPEEVYLILVRGGHVSPQREEDQAEVPAMVTMEGPEYNLMQQGGAGSMANPVSVI